MTAHHIKFEKRDDGIAILTIDRAEKRNAMTYAMLAAFIGKVRDVAEDDSVRVLIVTGAGGTFCACPCIRHQPPVRKVPRKARARRDDAHIALAGKFRTHAHGIAINCPDHRLRARDQRPPDVILVRLPAHAAYLA